MGSCCENDCGIEQLRNNQRGTLKTVLAINAVMFIVIAGAAFYGNSAALLSDSIDNLGDTLTYGLSLYVVAQGAIMKAKVALFKGSLIFIGACIVVGQIAHRLFVPVLPDYSVMSIFSVAGLVANSACLFLLWRHRAEDINMSSVWECSRNDIASNLSVFVAAGAVLYFKAGWPDILVASCLAVLLMCSAFRVIRSAIKELKATP